jgi:hypothetical protein
MPPKLRPRTIHERFEIKKINHQKADSLDGACTGMVEERSSPLRRTGIDIASPVCFATGRAGLRNDAVAVIPNVL